MYYRAKIKVRSDDAPADEKACRALFLYIFRMNWNFIINTLGIWCRAGIYGRVKVGSFELWANLISACYIANSTSFFFSSRSLFSTKYKVTAVNHAVVVVVDIVSRCRWIDWFFTLQTHVKSQWWMPFKCYRIHVVYVICFIFIGSRFWGRAGMSMCVWNGVHGCGIKYQFQKLTVVDQTA